MRLLDTLNYFIQQSEGDLQGLEWDIREETNYDGDHHQLIMDDLCDSYDHVKLLLEDLHQIKSVIEQLEAKND
jgi:NADH:ubiquinone oxidoreductase subunit D